jgi:DNA-binding transcriptional regulator LsrR (DeoR family)
MDHNEFLAQIASLYYQDNLTQAEIARRIGTSRSTISRLLHQAREERVIEITIHYLRKNDAAIEQELITRFGLRQARVLIGYGRTYEEILSGLGVLAARYIEGLLTKGTVLGISWGTAVHSTVEALQPNRKMPITVVQMIGAVGTGDPLIDGPDLARRLVNLYGGECHHLHAPLVVEHANVWKALLEEPRIAEPLSLADHADIALVGIGSPVAEMSSLLRAGFLDRAALARLRSQGAVGDICSRHYDAHGRVIDIELNQRTVGIQLETLHGIERVIGVAAGEAKTKAILGALRGRHINVLVTDDATARKVLAMDGASTSRHVPDPREHASFKMSRRAA